jgi:hypothetical protein
LVMHCLDCLVEWHVIILHLNYEGWKLLEKTNKLEIGEKKMEEGR